MFVYSVLNAFARGGGELSGRWLVAGLDTIGHSTAAARQTLYRMESDGILETRRAGREKFYRLSASAIAEVDAGYDKLFQPVPETWDGKWSIVRLVGTSTRRQSHDRLLGVLETHGFAPLGTGLYLHPRDHTARIIQAARDLGIASSVTVFRGQRASDGDDATFVRALWNLDEIARRYDVFLERFTPLARKANHTPLEGFLLRYAVAMNFLSVAWDDPELPLALLPRNWPAPRAQTLAATTYKKMLPKARAFAETLGASPPARATARRAVKT